MRVWRVVMVMLGLGVSSFAQTLAPPAASLQHATAVASSSATIVAAGERVLLWVDVTPKRGVHLYAAGARDFTPVALVMTPLLDLQTGRAQFPPGEPLLTVGATTPVPVYQKLFRITQPITIARTRSAGTLVVAAALNYQACDDKICYPPTTAAVRWNLTVK